MFKNPFKIKETLSESDIKTGLKMYVFDGVFSMGMATLQGGIYLTAFALAIGATQKEIGLIASIGFISQLMQFIGLYIINKYPKRKLLTIISASISRFLWIPIILFPFLNDFNFSFLLLILLLSAMIGAIPGPAWNSLLRDLIPSEKMGNINSKRITYSTTIALILTLSGGYAIDWWGKFNPQNELFIYSILFAIGFISGFFGLTALIQIPETTSHASKVSIFKLIKSPIKDKNFKRLIVFLSFWTFAVNMSGPFFMVYMLGRLKISLFMVTVLIVTSQLTNILFLKVWGRIADRSSNKSVLNVSGPLFLLVILSWAFTAMPDPHQFTIPLLFFIHIMNGIAVAGVSIGTANIALKLSPKGQAHGYMTVIGLFSSIAGALAPLAGGFFADFFKNVQLDLPVILKISEDVYSLPILNFKGLDFLFLLTFIVGIYAIHRLALVNEEGSVDRKDVIDDLTEAVITPLKSLSIVAGAQRIAIMPISGLMHMTNTVRNQFKKKIIKKLF